LLGPNLNLANKNWFYEIEKNKTSVVERKLDYSYPRVTNRQQSILNFKYTSDLKKEGKKTALMQLLKQNGNYKLIKDEKYEKLFIVVHCLWLL
jgi:hypothetical protein